MVKKKLPALDRLPIRFVLCIVGTEYILFTAFWCIPGLQLEIEPSSRDAILHRRALVGSVFFHFTLIIFIISFYRTIIEDPGSIPDTVEWTTSPDPLKLHERDIDGQLRFCTFLMKHYPIFGYNHSINISWVLRFVCMATISTEPDRCHYCSQLGRNILRMDHFCPWVANGIGFRNYKFFFLSLFYGLLCIGTVTWFMGTTFFREWNNAEISWGILYFNFLGAFLGLYMTLILLPFFIFHLWLMAKNRTTIEFCELAGKRASTRNYDLGNIFYNFATILGVNPHYWLWPVGDPMGDGLTFHTYESFHNLPNKKFSCNKF